MPVDKVDEVEHLAAPILTLQDHSRARCIYRDHLDGLSVEPIGGSCYIVTNKGALVSGAIVLGAIGSDLTYDAAGRRATVTTTVASTTLRESYSYLLEGQLLVVAFDTVAADGTFQAGGLSSLSYDGADRLTRQIDSDASGVAYNENDRHRRAGQLPAPDNASIPVPTIAASTRIVAIHQHDRANAAAHQNGEQQWAKTGHSAC